MNASHDVERTLERLGAEWPAQTTLVERVMQEIESKGVHPTSCARGRARSRISLAVAAAVALLASAWWLLLPVEQSLYAQALRAIENARTIHHVMRTVSADGKPAQVAVESWFERGVGFRVNLPHEIRLGNPEHFWAFRAKDRRAIRSDSRSFDKLVERELDLNQMLAELERLGTQRFAEGDETVDGKQLKAYLLTMQNVADPNLKDESARAVVLLDAQSRIVRARHEKREGDRWVTTLLSDWQYDKPIERDLFKPDFGEHVRVVDADEAFDQFVSLDKALYQDERRGIIFAIHRLERFAGDGVLVVSSVRATPQVMEKYPLEPRRIQLGLYFAEGPASNLHTSPQGNGYFRIELAKVSAKGIDVCWWVMVPRGTNPPPYEVEPGKVKLPLGFTPIGWTAYGKTFADEKGILQHVVWDAVVDLPETDDPQSFGDVSQSVYADMTALSVLPLRQLFLGTKPGTDSLDVRSPDEVSAAEYRVGAAKNISQWYERDLAFQLNGQFKPEMQRDSAGWAGTPAIGVSYNSLVSDFTLAEIAKRTSIERLYLDGTKITDNGLKELAPLTNLKELSLNETSISDSGLKHLVALRTLKKLYVHGTRVTAQGVAELKQAIPGLEVLE